VVCEPANGFTHIGDSVVQAAWRTTMREGVICEDVTCSHERPQLLDTPPKGATYKTGRNGNLDWHLKCCEDSTKWPVCQRPIIKPQAHRTR